MKGKRSKVRIVPISPSCPSVLFWYASSPNHALLFPASSGGVVCVHNVRRDLVRLLDRDGVQQPEGSFHAWRRLFARTFHQSGDSVVTLSRLLGHSDLATTRDHYISEDTDDLLIASRIHS